MVDVAGTRSPADCELDGFGWGRIKGGLWLGQDQRRTLVS